ncbi:MAG: hypothetical protein JWQ71_1462 [Pedosphaera sp.]|nr:hypothetical protein [Pedosphaera sp.]
MKLFIFTRKLALLPALFAVLALTSSPASAQMTGGSPAKGMDAAMMKLFGSNNSFASKAEIRILDKSGRPTSVIPMNFTLLEGKTRMDIDLTQIKSSDMPPNAIPMLKQIGMDKMTQIKRPDKAVDLSIYPGLKAYVEAPSSKEEIADAAKNYKMDKSKLGKETIDGHPCEKNKVVLTDDKGQKTEATTWNATDLKDFPVQIQMVADGENLLMKFSDIKLSKPSANQFEVPTGMAKYTNQAQLMQIVTQRMLGNAQGATDQK